MTREQLRQYIEIDFASALMSYSATSAFVLKARQQSPPSACEHHGVPASRAVALERNAAPTQQEFWLAWYVTTLLHQAVHRYAPEAEGKWHAVFSAHALPMVQAGMGCWRAARPNELLKVVRVDESSWSAVCDFISQDSIAMLSKAGIDGAALMAYILTDKDFANGNRLEHSLATRLRAVSQ